MRKFVPILVVVLSLFTYQRMAFGQAEATKEHELLKREAGTWTAQMKIWMQPDAAPLELPATETNTMLGELWMITKFDAGPFQGRGHMGYDSRKKKFVGTWIDNMTDHLALMTGDHDEKTGEMTMYSTSLSPTTGKIEKTKSVTKFTGEDSKLMTMYTQNADGAWRKSFEIKYARAKQ